MVSIPKKVEERLSRQVANFQKYLREAKDRDINESDTVTLVTDILASVFGFDKYSDITTEQAIRGTYCDLAVKVDGTVQYLIEVKAIGLELKETHLRQAVNYGANQGVQWVVLTNGVQWRAYGIRFEKPIDCDLVFEVDFLQISAKRDEDLAILFLLCKEGLSKEAIKAYHERVQTVNRFVIAALIQSEPVLNVIRRELKRLAPEAKVEREEIEAILPEILKRDALEGEQALRAQKQVDRHAARALRRARQASEEEREDAERPVPASPTPPRGSAPQPKLTA
jgi:predicted type IV restriction endonuclease